MNYGFSKQELEQIFSRGIKDNPAIRNILHRGKNTSLQLYSIKDKTQHGELYVYVSEKLIKKVKSLSDFRSLSYIIISSRVFVVDNKVKKREYLKDLP